MATLRTDERGSALTEAAIIFPCLVLIIYWSAALTDVMVLKLKAAEALRYALWETTVFKPPPTINNEVQAKFVDLRSPRDENKQFTGLLMYPLTKDMLWSATVDTTSRRVRLGGNWRRLPGGGLWDQFVNLVLGGLSRLVDVATDAEKFNVHGMAAARVTLVHARHDEQASPILKGGDLLGLKGGNDLDHPPSMTNFTFQAPLPSQSRPGHEMRLIFDTWKAWPKPNTYNRGVGDPLTDQTADPQKTYPEVEKQVTAQVRKIAFFGIGDLPGYNTINNILNSVLHNGLTRGIMGGDPPGILSVDRMDSNNRGQITILPPEPIAEGWAPHRCEIGRTGNGVNCPSQRLGDATATSGMIRPDDDHSIPANVDRSRYTVPYKINTWYWNRSGGTRYPPGGTQLSNPKASLVTNNEYVKSYRCRGHFFAGSTHAQEADSTKRNPRCR